MALLNIAIVHIVVLRKRPFFLKLVDHDIAKPEENIEKNIEKTYKRHRISNPSVAVKYAVFPLQTRVQHKLKSWRIVWI